MQAACLNQCCDVQVSPPVLFLEARFNSGRPTWYGLKENPSDTTYYLKTETTFSEEPPNQFNLTPCDTITREINKLTGSSTVTSSPPECNALGDPTVAFLDPWTLSEYKGAALSVGFTTTSNSYASDRWSYGSNYDIHSAQYNITQIRYRIGFPVPSTCYLKIWLIVHRGMPPNSWNDHEIIEHEWIGPSLSGDFCVPDITKEVPSFITTPPSPNVIFLEWSDWLAADEVVPDGEANENRLYVNILKYSFIPDYEPDTHPDAYNSLPPWNIPCPWDKPNGFPNTFIGKSGCNDPFCENYDPSATCNDGSCAECSYPPPPYYYYYYYYY